MKKFVFLGTSHVVVLILTGLLTWAFVHYGRKWKGQPISDILGRIPAITLVGSSVAYGIYRVAGGFWELRYDLPMQLCTWASVAVVIAAFTRNQFAFELSYFWIMAGSIHGTLTPNLQFDFPHIYYFIYFAGHVSLIIALFYFLYAWNMRPSAGSVLRVFLFTQFYFVVALGVNFLLDANYGYLMAKPENPSIMDFLGPWPRYLLELEVIAFVLFYVLYLPFRSAPGPSADRAPLEE